MLPPERALCIAPGIAATITLPNRASAIAAIILPTDVLPRSGPGRLHAFLCRRLAAAGIPAMRIDSSSLDAEAAIPHPGRKGQLPYRDSILAMNALERATGISRHLLVGTGAGACGAFHAALSDRRVAGIALINPHDFVGDPAWTAMVLVQRYIRRSSRSLWSWIKLVNGRADYRRILTTLSGRMMSWATGKDALAKARAHAIATSMLKLIMRGCPVVYLVTDRHSSRDHALALFGTVNHSDFQNHTIHGADHLLRTPQQQEEAIECLVAWAVRCSAIRDRADAIMDDPSSDRSAKEMDGKRRA